MYLLMPSPFQQLSLFPLGVKSSLLHAVYGRFDQNFFVSFTFCRISFTSLSNGDSRESVLLG